MLLWAGVVLIPCPIVLPVELLLEPALILLIELDFHWRGRRELLFTEHVAEALAVQFANPRFYGQLPFVLRGGFGSNERIGPKAKSLGHFDVIPIEPAEPYRLRPTVLLRLLAHAMLKRFYADFPSERKCETVGECLSRAPSSPITDAVADTRRCRRRLMEPPVRRQ